MPVRNFGLNQPRNDYIFPSRCKIVNHKVYLECDQNTHAFGDILERVLEERKRRVSHTEVKCISRDEISDYVVYRHLP